MTPAEIVARGLTVEDREALMSPSEHVSAAYKLCGAPGLLSVMYAVGRGLRNPGPRFEATALGREVRAVLTAEMERQKRPNTHGAP